MIRNTIIICAAVALIGGIIRLFIAAGSERIAKVLSIVLGIILMITLIKSISNAEFSNAYVYESDQPDFENIGKETIESICKETEEKIEKLISEEIRSRFNLSPYICEILISREDFTVTYANLYFKSDNILISTYEIINFLKTKYEIEVEVVFI